MDRRQSQGIFQHQGAFLSVVGKAAAGAAQGKGGPEHHGIADFFRRPEALFQGVGNLTGEDRLAQRGAQLLKKLPVLRPLDGLEAGAQDLAVALVQNALFGKLHRKVQSRLSAQGGKDGIRPLVADNPGHIFQVEGLHIHLVGNVRIRHDGGGVGVDEHHLIPLLPEGQTGLGAGIVEFRRLSDDNGAGTDHQNLMNISTLRHSAYPPSRFP